jgi:hypothetical protein
VVAAELLKVRVLLGALVVLVVVALVQVGQERLERLVLQIEVVVVVAQPMAVVELVLAAPVVQAS